jgi:hypothetical protein
MRPIPASPPARLLLGSALVTLSSLLAGCGSDAKTTAAVTIAPVETAAADDTTSLETAAPTDTAASLYPTEPVESAAPVETAAPEAPEETEVPEGVTVIDVDADFGSPWEQTVPLGTELMINVVSATDQEFHLHGYELEAAGTEVTFEFTANKAGEFELESHDTEAVLLILTVI